MATFKYQIISTQPWNNNQTQILSQHKTLKSAEKILRQIRDSTNTYHIEEII